jgi:1-acyl-sn-glycerol-3-phosphate acyltransferase
MENVPRDQAYVLCFSHPNWVDPFLIVSHWPAKPRLFVFGPREEDMAKGWRNRLLHWSGMSVPFKPSRTDLLDTTRRATGVLNAGYVLCIAGEGRLSDREGEIVPLYEGAAYFALRARVPILPMAIIGTRWLRFGKRVTMRAAEPVLVDGLRGDRAGVSVVTERVQAEIERMIEGAPDEPPPGPFGRWLTDLFADRPWLDDENWDAGRKGSRAT